MLEHLAVARADDAVRVLVFTSSDHLGLSAGADVREELDEEGRVRRMQLFADLYDAIVGFPKPTIAVCHGDVVGGGAEIADRLRHAGRRLQPADALPRRGARACRSAPPAWSPSAAWPPPSTCCSPRARSAPTRRCGSGSSTASPPRPATEEAGARPRRRGRRPPARGGRPPEADARTSGTTSRAAPRAEGEGQVEWHEHRSRSTVSQSEPPATASRSPPRTSASTRSPAACARPPAAARR